MREEDLEIGQKYTVGRDFVPVTVVLEAFGKNGDPILRPVGKNPYILYTKEDEKSDPECREGCFKNTKSIFLECFSKVNQ